MAMYYNGKKVRNLYYNGKCITRLALGKEMIRLVEGDDFVRAEWLQGRNGAYIDTGYLVKALEDVYYLKARYDGTTRNPTGKEQNLFGMQTTNAIVVCYIDSANQINAIIKKDPNSSNHNIGISTTDIELSLYTTSTTEYIVELNGTSYTNPLDAEPRSVSNRTMYIFSRNGLSERYFHGDIAYFRITDPTFSTDRVNMFPCRLLRPIPAALDANGIARNADECGMYNSVNGLFYGNVGSGSFTVSDN